MRPDHSPADHIRPGRNLADLHRSDQNHSDYNPAGHSRPGCNLADLHRSGLNHSDYKSANCNYPTFRQAELLYLSIPTLYLSRIQMVLL